MAGRPLIHARDPPSARNVRRSWHSSPSSNSASRSHASAAGASRRSNIATSSARSAPWRTMPLSARKPDRKLSASTRSDLPAPVSPEMTVRPGAEFQFGRRDDGEVLDGQMGQHGADCAGAPHRGQAWAPSRPHEPLGPRRGPACSNACAAGGEAYIEDMSRHSDEPGFDPHALDSRSRHLLRSLIGRYIREGEPVGSQTLARHAGLDVSPATIRNILADLEDAGLLTSPHTSAGRVPTAQGYRVFVDSLLQVRPLPGGRTRASATRAAGGLGHAVAAGQCVGTAVGDEPFRRRGQRAAARAVRVPPHRFRAAGCAARARDPGVRRQRRAEPHHPDPPRLRCRRTGTRLQLPQPSLRGPAACRHPHDARARTQGRAQRDGSAARQHGGACRTGVRGAAATTSCSRARPG